ncbi:hypothetical protein FB451DRAFT_1164314 [Mycena latifolia]|nr:hypothetical protein FB451DRAFT_1164314 [Mycena latifolia]
MSHLQEARWDVPGKFEWDVPPCNVHAGTSHPIEVGYPRSWGRPWHQWDVPRVQGGRSHPIWDVPFVYMTNWDIPRVQGGRSHPIWDVPFVYMPQLVAQRPNICFSQRYTHPPFVPAANLCFSRRRRRRYAHPPFVPAANICFSPMEVTTMGNYEQDCWCTVQLQKTFFSNGNGTSHMATFKAQTGNFSVRPAAEWDVPHLPKKAIFCAPAAPPPDNGTSHANGTCTQKNDLSG